MKDYTLKDIARLILEGHVIHQNSYVPGKSLMSFGTFTKTQREAFSEVAAGDKDLEVFLNLASYWRNDLQEWADRSYGLGIVQKDGKYEVVERQPYGHGDGTKLA